jgi:hypothetical protein
MSERLGAIMNECRGCQKGFVLDINKGLIGQDYCPKCQSNIDANFRAILAAGSK